MIVFDRKEFEETARAVFTTDSPSGFTGDIIALRGKGKAAVDDFDGSTKKNRLRLRVKKYV